MLRSIYLKNFRKHEELSLNFEQGLTGVFGSNAKGKSAILLAIGVAIGGPGWARGFKLERRGTDNFEVQLTMDLGNNQYRVMRNKSGAKLHQVSATGEKLIATAQGQVNIELGKLLGMPVDRWLELHFVKQKQAAQMFEAGAAKMNLLVEELTGVRTISLVIDKLGAKAKASAAAHAALIPLVLPEDALAERQQQLELAQQALVESSEMQQAAAQRLEALNHELPNLTAKLGELRTQLTKAKNFARSHAENSRDLLNLIRQRDGLRAPARATSVVQELLGGEQESLKSWRTWLPQFIAVFNAVERKQDAIKAFKSTPAPTRVDTAPLEKAVVDNDSAMNDLKGQAATLLGQAAAAQARMQEIKAALASGICSACNRPMDDTDEAHRTALNDELSTLKAKYESSSSKAGELQDKAAEHKAARDAANSALRAAGADNQAAEGHEARARDLEEGLVALQEELAKVQAEAPDVTLEVAEAEIAGLELSCKRLESELAECRAYDRQRAGVDAEIAKVEKAIDELGDVAPETEDQLNARQTAIEELGSDLAAKNNEVENQRRTGQQQKQVEAQHRQSVSVLNKVLADQADLNDQVKQREAELAETEGFQKYLRDNRSRYLQRAWDLILGRASQFCSAVTDGNISEIRRTEAGKFEFIEQEEVCDVNEASGAQSAILGLGVQVALSETLPTSLDLLLADEPTADMDADHSSACLLSLSAVSKQALVISHHRMDESICSEVIEL